MAVIQYTGIVNQIRGKLNGSQFNKTKTISTMQRKAQQPQGSRGFQSEVRQYFSRYQRTWKSIGAGNQTNWQLTANNNPVRDRFGVLVSLSGYNQFIKASMLAEYANQVAPVVPYTSPAPPADVNAIGLTSTVFSRSAAGSTSISATVSKDVPSLQPAYGIIIEVSLPVSTGVTTYHGRFTVVYGGVLSNTLALIDNENLGSRYPLPTPGQRMFIRARVVHIASGAVVFESVSPLFYTVST